jgi:hypothetical protein
MSATILSRPRSTLIAVPPQRRFLAAGALVLLGVAIYLVFVAPIRQVDLDVFLRAGQAVLHGHDPYSSTHSETIRTNAAFVYPVAVAWWFAPLSAIGSASHLIYAIASLLAIGLACWWARPGQPLIAALVLLSSAAVIGLQDGSVNPWLLLGLIAAWRWRDRPVVTGLVVAALIICKLFLWPVLGWLLLSRRYRATATAAVMTGVVLVAGFTFGPLRTSAYASMLHVLSGLEAPHAASLSGLLIHWHASLALATVIATAVALLLLAAAGYKYRRGPQNDGREVLVFGAAVVAALFASPIVWHHYYLLLAAPLLLATRSVWPFVVLSLASWAAAAPHATTQVHTAIGYVLGLGGIGVIAVIAAVRGWRQSSSIDNALTRAFAAIRTARPVAVVAALAALTIVGVSVMQKVSVGGGWGALVTVVETAGVLAYVWSRRADSTQVERGLVRSN